MQKVKTIGMHTRTGPRRFGKAHGKSTAWNSRKREYLRCRLVRRLYFSEQLKRLELLREFYQSDRARLQTIHASGEAFLSIKDGMCAVCGSLPGADAPLNIQQLQTSCAAEIAKLDVLERELARGIADMRADESATNAEIDRLSGAVAKINQQLQDRLKPQNQTNRAELKALFAAKDRLQPASQLQQEIADLEKRQSEITGLLSPAKKPAPSAITPSRRFEQAFCDRVSQMLLRWRFPVGNGVRFDAEKFDLVIGDQYRGSFGKGYRAMTHAAFTISLMQHCREFDFPHPGFVLLDTPLNPLREPDKGRQGGASTGLDVSDEMKAAFFEDLARDQSGDQIIVFENSEPPSQLENLHYEHFTKNPAFGRYGFFPVPPPPPQPHTI